MLRKLWLPAVIGTCLLFSVTIARATQMEIYGAWHCGNGFCTWATVRDVTNFDNANHWMIDRGDGMPSVNLVVLSFVNPLKLLNQTNDSQTVNGAPIGMNSAIVSLLHQPQHSCDAFDWRYHLHQRLGHGAEHERCATGNQRGESGEVARGWN